jgi:transcriptional antiterminator Rof (Rho-off)
MSTAAVRAFTTDHIVALSSDQFVAMSSGQFAAMTATQAAAIQTADIAGIETADLRALSSAAVRGLSDAQIGALTTDQLTALSTAQISAMTTAQVANLATADLNTFTSAQFSAFTSAQIGALTTDQFSALDTAHIAALTSTQIDGVTVAQIQSITTDQIAGLETADLASMTMTQVAGISGGQFAAMTDAQRDAMLSVSPIVLDLDGNGVHTTAAANGVNFDLNATGTVNKVGWVSATDGLLVMDRNHDGKINDGSELFGSATRTNDGKLAGNGYVAMAQEDTNHDLKLDANDAHFKDLRVWVDANHDGKTDAGELKTLGELGITSLDLHAKTGTEVDNGNLLGLVSNYTTTDGAKHEMADVWFTKDTTPAAETTAKVSLSDVLAAPTTDLMPGLTSGAVSSGTTPPAHTGAVPPSSSVLDDDSNKPLPLI